MVLKVGIIECMDCSDGIFNEDNEMKKFYISIISGPPFLGLANLVGVWPGGDNELRVQGGGF